MTSALLIVRDWNNGYFVTVRDFALTRTTFLKAWQDDTFCYDTSIHPTKAAALADAKEFTNWKNLKVRKIRDESKTSKETNFQQK